MDDFLAFDEEYQVAVARHKVKSAGGAVLNLTREGSVGLLRRAFLIAYGAGALGLDYRFSEKELADWLTTAGYKTTKQAVKDAKSKSKSKALVLGIAPRTEQVMALYDLLKSMFPAADLEALLADADT